MIVTIREDMTTEYQRGQVLLIVVLIITVVLTVSLSLFTRSIVNVKLAAEEDQSQRALSAAEAGIEQTIIADSAIPNGTFSNNAGFSTSKRQLSGTEFLLNNGKLVFKDEGADIWLSEYSTDSTQAYKNPITGTLTVYWGSSTDSCTASESINTMAAIEIVLISGNKSSPTTTRYAFDPCAARRASNNFSSSDSSVKVIGNKTFTNSAVLSVSSGLIARVIPLYANSYFGMQSSPALPPQGTVIESTGTVGDVKRRVSVLQENPLLPAELFNYSLFLTR